MIALAGAAALSGALIQSATGFGFALVLSPALFAVLDPYEAVTTMLVLGLMLNVLVLLDAGEARADRSELVPLMLAAMPGLVLGAVALALLSKSALQIAVGVGVMAAAAWQLRARILGVPPLPAVAASRRTAWVAGMVSGVLTTSISVSGPALVLWLEARGKPPAELRQSLAVCFLVLNVVGGAMVLAVGGTGAIRPGVLLPFLGLVVVGHVLGASVFRRLAGWRFSIVALGLVLVTGTASLVAGVAGL